MGQTLYNGAEVPTPGDSYALTDDLKKMCLSLNIPIPVMNQGQRDALFGLVGGALPTGTIVIRRDQSMRMEVWDGTRWADGAPHTEWTKADHTIPTNQVYGVGALTQDADKTNDVGFVSHPAADVLRFRDAGTYAVAFSFKASATLNNRAFVQFDLVGGNDPVRVVVTGEDRGLVTIPNLRVPANQQVLFTVYHESGANRIGDVRIRVTRSS
jgi:hypothetical protein